jgi:hypothetical protein
MPRITVSWPINPWNYLNPRDFIWFHFFPGNPEFPALKTPSWKRLDDGSHALSYENTSRFSPAWKWLWYASGDMVSGLILANGVNISVFRKWRKNGARTGLFQIGRRKTGPLQGFFSIGKDTIRRGVLRI